MTRLPSAAEAQDAARRVQTALGLPFEASGSEVVIEVRLGLVVVTAADINDARRTHGPSAQLAGVMLSQADAALHQAQVSGTSVAQAAGDTSAHAAARVTMLREVRSAITNGELSLEYQPKVEVSTGRVRGVEALVRWQHPVRGKVSPGEFIPLAESTGLIHALTDHVLETAIRQCRAWLDAGGEFTVAVNVCPRSLTDQRIVERVRELLAVHDVPTALLVIEVTESSVMSDRAESAAVLSALRNLGAKVSIDDFGQ